MASSRPHPAIASEKSISHKHKRCMVGASKDELQSQSATGVARDGYGGAGHSIGANVVQIGR
jgi:hypothetical protein